MEQKDIYYNKAEYIETVSTSVYTLHFLLTWNLNQATYNVDDWWFISEHSKFEIAPNKSWDKNSFFSLS